MNEQNIKLSVVAYYLSKFDLDAVDALGYKNRTAAMTDISNLIGNGNNYLKLRRDEFDVLTDSHRRGYTNRVPVRGVLEMHDQLKHISFEDFTKIVLQFISLNDPPSVASEQKDVLEIASTLTDAQVEAIVNAKDLTSTIKLRQSSQKVRVYSPLIIDNLKKLYNYRCQICGYSTEEFGAHICEAHHILPFFEFENNDSNNIIILCPNHHRLIHSGDSKFDRKGKVFLFPNHAKLHLMLNLHL